METLDRWIDKRPNVLIVDDVEENRKLIETYLLKEGLYRVALAQNGLEAISAFKKQTVSLILLDMEMPVMDGYTAVRIIRKLEGVPKIPIIAMTAHERREEVSRCKRAGCSAYLHKPVSDKELLTAVHSFLDKETTAEEETTPGEDILVCADPDLAEFIPGYLDNRRNDVKDIGRLLIEGNFLEIRKIGHNMKGSGGGYGFDGISLLGGEIEEAAIKGDKVAAFELNNKLAGYLSRVKVVPRNNP